MPEPRVTDADIERMEAGIEAYNAGDFDALRQLVAPDVVLERITVLDEPPVKGWDAFRAFLEPEIFAWQRFYPLEWTINGDKVLLHMRVASRAAASGVELEVEGWMVWTVTDGVVTRIANFVAGQEAEARAAAGLERESSP